MGIVGSLIKNAQSTPTKLFSNNGSGTVQGLCCSKEINRVKTSNKNCKNPVMYCSDTSEDVHDPSYMQSQQCKTSSRCMGLVMWLMLRKCICPVKHGLIIINIIPCVKLILCKHHSPKSTDVYYKLISLPQMFIYASRDNGHLSRLPRSLFYQLTTLPQLVIVLCDYARTRG